MKQFLQENWLYIVVPIAIVLIGAVALVFFIGDPGPAPFVYAF